MPPWPSYMYASALAISAAMKTPTSTEIDLVTWMARFANSVRESTPLRPGARVSWTDARGSGRRALG